MKLYGYFRSSATWRVRVVLNLKAIPHEYQPVHLVKEGGVQNSDWYRGLNPMRSVPLLEWEEEGQVRRLAQSLPIIEFLEERFPDRPILPQDPYLKAQARMVAEMINSGIQPLQNLSVLKHLKAELKADEQAWARHWIDRGLTAVEAVLTGTAGRYAVGDQVSLADACLIPQLFNARRFGVDVSRFPTALRVEQACEALPAFDAAQPSKQPDAE
ncbi:MAG: maleylacetoacetate isomerase [Myxococcota bacterium]|nr:maleylacetoacetate isomerase [Myxococcota bacterium]